MSVVLYCGDPHGQFRHILRAAAELNPSAVVLLGDLEPQRPLHEELEAIAFKTWFIHGNHDTDSVLASALRWLKRPEPVADVF